jgi:nitrobindin-like protein
VSEPAPHPDVAPLAGFIGTWRGEGTGEYPTIETFAFGEETRFWNDGKPHLLFAQRTWILDDGRPSHSEMGYWRPLEDGRLEMTAALATGHVEVALGTLTAATVSRTVVELESASILRTPTTKDVTAIRRRFELDGDVLTYDSWMAAVGTPITLHIRGQLHRST